MSLDRINDWYRRQCDGDWEHQGGIKLETVDNPGWLLQVEFNGAPHCFTADANSMAFNDGPDDWLHYRFDGEQDRLTLSCSPQHLKKMADAFIAGVGGRT